MDEAAINDGRLLNYRPQFIATKEKHNDVPIRYFGRLLKTSSLPPITPN